MNGTLRGIFSLLGFALIAALAYFGARFWQSAQTDYERVETPVACDLRSGPCQQPVAGGSVSLSILPADIPLMRPLRLTVAADGLAERAVEVEIRGLNMEMGLNRTALSRTADGRWEGETILPFCSQTRMMWEAAVRLDAATRYEVAFDFETTRP